VKDFYKPGKILPVIVELMGLIPSEDLFWSNNSPEVGFSPKRPVFSKKTNYNIKAYNW
jgi:hypothetical protein